MKPYIKVFNKKVENLFELYPNREIFNLIKKYKDDNNYIDYYQTLDNLGSCLKCEFIMDILCIKDKYYYKPCIKYYDNNINTCEFYYPNGSNDKFNSLTKAYEFIAKEYLYFLEREKYIDNIRLRLE